MLNEVKEDLSPQQEMKHFAVRSQRISVFSSVSRQTFNSFNAIQFNFIFLH